MKLKKWIGLLLAGAMMVGTMTGCLGHFFTRAMTIEGRDISAGMYLMMQLMAYGEASSMVADPEADVLDQRVVEPDEDAEDAPEAEGETGEEAPAPAADEGVDATEWIRARAEELCLEYTAVLNLCESEGITLSEENAAAVDQNMEYWYMWADYYAENGVGEETGRQYMEFTYLREQLFEQRYGEEGPEAPSRDEVAAAYAEDNAHVQSFTINLNDAEGNPLPNAADIRAAAETLLTDLESGSRTMEEAGTVVMPTIRQMEEGVPLSALSGTMEADTEPTAEDTGDDEAEAPAEEAGDATGEETPEAENSEAEPEVQPEDTLEAPTPVAPSRSYISYTSTTYSEAFLEELKAQPVGAYGLYEGDGTLMLYQVIETFETDADYELVRDNVVHTLRDDSFEEYLSSVYSTYTLQWATGAQWYLSPQKIVR